MAFLVRDYIYVNVENAAKAIRADLLAYGYTEDDIDWLLAHGWDPLSPVVDPRVGCGKSTKALRSGRERLYDSSPSRRCCVHGCCSWACVVTGVGRFASLCRQRYLSVSVG